MKNRVAAFVAAVLLLCAPAAFSEEETEEVFATAAKAAVLISAVDGRVLYEKNANTALPMASTTKVMTALMAIENTQADEVVTVSQNAFGVPGTSIYLSKGEKLTMLDMLYGLMLASGNDAAVSIAEHVSGSVDAFCEAMTLRAQEIGCRDTVFKNPHGLPNTQHHTTAYDLALIAREAMRQPLFREIVSTQHAKIPWEGRTYDRVLNNKNRLLADYEGSTGIKTGYTKAAGRCLVFSAKRDGLEVIGVVLNCGDWFNEAEKIMDDGFSRYGFVSALEDKQSVRQIAVNDSDGGPVEAVMNGALEGTVLLDSSTHVDIQLPDIIEGGVQGGEKLGVARLYENEKLICETDIVALSTVYPRTFQNTIRRIVHQWVTNEW